MHELKVLNSNLQAVLDLLKKEPPPSFKNLNFAKFCLFYTLEMARQSIIYTNTKLHYIYF